MALANVFKRFDQRSSFEQSIPFDLRERQNVARILRRARLRNFVGTVVMLLLLGCGLFALTAVRLSNDPDYIRPW